MVKLAPARRPVTGKRVGAEGFGGALVILRIPYRWAGMLDQRNSPHSEAEGRRNSSPLEPALSAAKGRLRVTDVSF
jgi:hypothetical protein